MIRHVTQLRITERLAACCHFQQPIQTPAENLFQKGKDLEKEQKLISYICDSANGRLTAVCKQTGHLKPNKTVKFMDMEPVHCSICSLCSSSCLTEVKLEICLLC